MAIVTVYSSPGFSNEKIYVYLARNLKKGNVHPDEDERIDLIYVTMDKAIDMINTGEIKDAKTAVGILTAKQYL